MANAMSSVPLTNVASAIGFNIRLSPTASSLLMANQIDRHVPARFKNRADCLVRVEDGHDRNGWKADLILSGYLAGPDIGKKGLVKLAGK